MATRVVEGKKPYTGGEAIDIDQNKVISLKLRDENNLIIYDEGDDEIYVDLQLPDGITPTDAFPVGVTTGRAVVADGWDKAGTIICAKTTSGDNIKLLYADDGTLWIDNGTGTFKQIYFKADVDALITTLTTYINTELAKKQNGVVSATAPSNPSEGDLWYDTTNSAMKVWDGTAWQSVGTGGGSDIEYVTQVEYDALPSSKLTDGKHYVIYTADSPTPPSPGWQPGVNTVAYYKFEGDLDDSSGNSNTLTSYTTATYGTTTAGKEYFICNGSNYCYTPSLSIDYSSITVNLWMYFPQYDAERRIFGTGWWDNPGPQMAMNQYNNELGPMSCGGSQNGDTDSFSYNTFPSVGWHNLVMTNDGINAKLYVDGVLVDTVGGASGTYSQNVAFGTIYAWRSQTARLFNGGFGDSILESKVRTAQEIADYYNQTKANYGIS